MKLRIVLIVLVLANVLFFGWSRMEGRPVAASTAPAVDGVLSLAVASARPRTHCQRLGPYLDESGASAALAALTARGFQAQVKQLEALRVTSWNVRVVGLGSKAARDAAEARLRRAGVSDTVVIQSTSGDIQLYAGVFRDAAGVKRRIATIENAGYHAQADEREQRVLERWINTELGVQATAPTLTELGLTPPTATGAAAPAWDSC
jgi:hypothetical protein